VGEERRKPSGTNDAARAMDYILKRRAVFVWFLDDGRICLVNSAVERTLRGIVPSRYGCLPDRTAVDKEQRPCRA
jgi:hypothetical protein